MLLIGLISDHLKNIFLIQSDIRLVTARLFFTFGDGCILWQVGD